MPDSTHAQVQRQLFLRSFFDVSPPAELAELLAERMRDRVFEKDEVLYERGQPPGPIFFVTRGTVELSAPDAEPWIFEDRAFIGAIDANTNQPHPRTARALTSVHAIEMHFEEYLELLEDFFDFAKASLVQGAKRTQETAIQLAPSGMFREPAEPSGPWLEKRQLDAVQRILVLKSSLAFQHAPVQPLVTLAHQAAERRFEAGESLFGAGDTNRGLFLVADGTVRVHHDDPHVEGTVGPGEMVLGLLGIVDEPYAFSAAAAVRTVMLEIAHEDLYDAMEEHFGLARSWWVYMGHENHRLRQALADRNAEPNEAKRAAG